MWATLAKMLGVPERAAEDVVKSERAAKITLSRRGLLLAGVSAMPALALGGVFREMGGSLPIVLRGLHRNETFRDAVVLAANASAYGCSFLAGIDKMLDGSLVRSSRIFQENRPICMEGSGIELSHSFIQGENVRFLGLLL